MTGALDLLFERVEALGLQDRIRRPASPVLTAAATAAEFGVPLSRIGRTIAAVTPRNNMVLIVGPASRRVDLRNIGALLHTPVRTIPKTELRHLTGYPSDGVSPVSSSPTGLVIIDSALENAAKDDASLLIAAGSADCLLEVTFEDLTKISRGIVIDFDAKPSGLQWSIDPSVEELGVRADFIEIQSVGHQVNIEELNKFVEEVAYKCDATTQSRGYGDLLIRAGVPDQVPSTEFLRSYVQRNRHLPRINAVVDCYNAMSLKLDVVASAHDADLLKGPIRVGHAVGGEDFHPIGAKKPVQLMPGEWYIRDQTHLLCRNNCKQSELSKIGVKTATLLIYVQGYAERSVDDLRSCLNSVAQTVVKYCGGKRAPVVYSGGMES